MRFSALVGLTGAAIACALWAFGQERRVARTWVKPALLGVFDAGERLRVFATPGDYKLDNGEITAVVRKRDGFLTELWQNRARLPSSEQLGTTTEIDGIWQIYPIAFALDQRKPAAIISQRVAALSDAIETDGVVEVSGTRYRALTQFRLDPSRPSLRIRTTFSVEGGGAGGPIGLGDLVKWGNVQYLVDGLASPRLSYQGMARWIGRRGAGGDLVLRRSDGQPLFVDYAGRIRGFQGDIHALYYRGGIAPKSSITIERELGYEKLPVSRPPPPAALGAIELEIVDQAGQPLAAKIRVDREGSDEPIFEDDGGLDGADRFLWTGSGRVRRELEPGRYRLLVTSGIEREAARFTVSLRAGKTETRTLRLRRVISTPGYVAADLHLHQAPSVDADISLPNRVVAIAAEGVEFAVATDHYVVTDLAPTVSWLKERGLLAPKLQTMLGSEVSTLGNRFGHFNVFPLRKDQNVIYDSTTPQALFADARKQSPNGVLQVNHPRMDPKIAYFSWLGLDENTGEPMNRAGWDASFDTLEVYNGDEAKDLKDVKKVLRDWLHLLGRGHRYAATGSSDSHSLAFLDPGLPRTMIRHAESTDDDADADASPSRIIEALKAGRSYVTSGPIIEASVGGAGPGETARGVGKRAKLDVVIRAAPWINVAWVEVLMGGNGKQLFWLKLPEQRGVVRLKRSFDIPVDTKTFVIVLAEGIRGLPNASRDNTLPFAFTNPIWLEP